MIRFKTEINGTSYDFLIYEKSFIVHSANGEELVFGNVGQAVPGGSVVAVMEDENKVPQDDWSELLDEIQAQMGIVIDPSSTDLE